MTGKWTVVYVQRSYFSYHPDECKISVNIWGIKQDIFYF